MFCASLRWDNLLGTFLKRWVWGREGMAASTRKDPAHPFHANALVTSCCDKICASADSSIRTRAMLREKAQVSDLLCLFSRAKGLCSWASCAPAVAERHGIAAHD